MEKLERRLTRLWRRFGGGRRKDRRSKKDESVSQQSSATNELCLTADNATKMKNLSPVNCRRSKNATAAVCRTGSARTKELSRALVKLYAYARLRSLQTLITAAESTPTLDSSTTTEVDSVEFRCPLEKFPFLSSLPQLCIPQLKGREFDKLCLSRESGYITNSPWDYSSSTETLRQQRSPSLAALSHHRLPHKTPSASTSRRRFHASHGDIWASSDILRYRSLDSEQFEPIEAYLSRNVYKSKCVTCVFEAVHAGLGVLIDDILAELDRWFVGQKMLVVASELHFSVPLSRRNRQQEKILKQQMLRSLLTNNRRILHLQWCKDELPVRLAEARTEENIFNDHECQAVQGVYQRCYRRLLPFVHSQTPDWHAPYWTLSQPPVRPQPSALLLDGNPSKFRTHTLVSLNIIGLSIRGIRHLSQGALA
ncbi:hypothetical protein Q1695_006042 [Nippostrongylus brasiliensis]|nr:hypothetical protein Q1695_006042 [Nippostrongylus brasiliensis]